MFRQPEEWIMAILAVLWCILLYFALPYTGASVASILMIAVANAVWTLIAFILWQRNHWYTAFPFLAGLFVLCLTPLLDDFASGNDAQNRVDVQVWYTAWTFKLLLAAAVIFVIYVYRLYRFYRNRKQVF